MEQCKERVSNNGWHWHTCRKPIWKDGYCKIHHPESVQKRIEKSIEKEKEKYELSPLGRLEEAQKEIEKLKKENEKLKKAIQQNVSSRLKER